MTNKETKLNEIIFDIETDGLVSTKIHCLSALYKGELSSVTSYDNIRNLFGLDPSEHIYIGHNIQRFDIPAIESITGADLSKCVFIDTLALSWYLYPSLRVHGLDEWGKTLGDKKVQIDDWENLSIDEYKKRCEQDVVINNKLWEQMKSELLVMYGSMKEVYRVCRYLTFKLKCARMAEESQWKIDIPHVEKSIQALEELLQPKLEALSACMPKVVKTKTMTKPKVLRKKDFSLTSAGERWYNNCKEQRLNPENTESIKIFSHEEEPNPSSSQQVKDWLFTLGWEPETFKPNKKGKEVPQLIKLDRSGLCDSVLSIDNPVIQELDGLFTINHRLSTLKAFLDNQKDGFVKAQVAGFTNTLRFKHSVIVNLPSVDAPYASSIRASLIARDGYILCGSDMSGLEDRTKQHYMVPHDPAYVEEMNTEDFDPHLDIALLCEMMTKEEVEYYKSGQGGPDMKRLKTIRHGAKTTNYSL